jgi:hypothetical protein
VICSHGYFLLDPLDWSRSVGEYSVGFVGFQLTHDLPFVKVNLSILIPVCLLDKFQ